MLSRENRLRLTEIATKVRLGRETSLAERILNEENKLYPKAINKILSKI